MAKITTTNAKVLQFDATLKNYRDCKTKAVAYAFSRNRAKIKDIVEAVNEARQELPEGFEEYQKKRDELEQGLAKKNAQEQPLRENKMVQHKYFGPIYRQVYVYEDPTAAEKALEEFDAEVENAKVKVAVDKHEKELADLFETEITVDVYQLAFEKIPEELIASQDWDIFNELVVVCEPVESTE